MSAPSTLTATCPATRRQPSNGSPSPGPPTEGRRTARCFPGCQRRTFLQCPPRSPLLPLPSLLHPHLHPGPLRLSPPLPRSHRPRPHQALLHTLPQHPQMPLIAPGSMPPGTSSGPKSGNALHSPPTTMTLVRLVQPYPLTFGMISVSEVRRLKNISVLVVRVSALVVRAG